MSTTFPATLDTYSAHTAGETIAAAHINNLQDAVAALQTKVGVDSSAVAASLDYKARREEIVFSFTTNGDVYYVVPAAVTFDPSTATAAGTGTMVYAKAVAATPTTFATITTSTAFAAGDVLRATCSAISGYKSVALVGLR